MIFGGELQTVLALPVSPAVDLFCDNPNGSRCWQTAPLTSASSGPLLQSALTLNGSTYAAGLSLIVTFLVAKGNTFISHHMSNAKNIVGERTIRTLRRKNFPLPAAVSGLLVEGHFSGHPTTLLPSTPHRGLNRHREDLRRVHLPLQKLVTTLSRTSRLPSEPRQTEALEGEQRPSKQRRANYPQSSPFLFSTNPLPIPVVARSW
ncbi:hypothetical protein EDB81DRAFT_312491 [Dactylonectria macrodidyma]|uniref:Uncharacterized protein n=1 Tax=Dactylonectria macrodidyma TaxID=307937 RepID=A0A9P9I9F3_9HYPO|nr:hypothetical protein EDB81DRAFT_312491 [Dactylonectria macrodidyma]